VSGYSGCCGGGVVVGTATGGTTTGGTTTGGGSLTAEQKKIFDDTIKEVSAFGEGEEVKKLVDEIKKISEGGDAAAQKEWIDTYTKAITPAEKKAFDGYVATLKTKEEKDAENAAWEAASPAGKRYYMAYLGLEAGEVKAPAKLVVTLPADAQLTINDEQTVSTSSRRLFVSPTLEPSKTYHYTLRATFTSNGAPVVVTRKVAVRAGKTVNVSLEQAQAVAAR